MKNERLAHALAWCRAEKNEWVEDISFLHRHRELCEKRIKAVKSINKPVRKIPQYHFRNFFNPFTLICFFREYRTEIGEYIKKETEKKKAISESKDKRRLRYIGNSIKYSILKNKNGQDWELLVGYTLDDLTERLEKTIPEGYNWSDFFKGELEIDHIIPVNVFNFSKLEHTDFKRCWALSNLRLLPAKENMIKNSKLSRPFQPALKI